MALIGYAVQQIAENRDYDIDYTDALSPSSDTVASVVASVSPTTSPPLQVTGVVFGTLFSKTWVTAGVDKTVYCVTVVTTSTAGRIIEDEFEIEIEETC